MQLEKYSTNGILFEGNSLVGLWFADRADALNTEKISWMLASQDAKGNFKTSERDYMAATLGSCVIKPGPDNLGGYFLFFPSSGVK
jgi:hypothetical protein